MLFKYLLDIVLDCIFQNGSNIISHSTGTSHVISPSKRTRLFSSTSLSLTTLNNRIQGKNTAPVLNLACNWTGIFSPSLGMHCLRSQMPPKKIKYTETTMLWNAQAEEALENELPVGGERERERKRERDLWRSLWPQTCKWRSYLGSESSSSSPIRCHQISTDQLSSQPLPEVLTQEMWAKQSGFLSYGVFYRSR